MAEAPQQHGKPLTRLVFRKTKILVIEKNAVKLFTRHYTSEASNPVEKIASRS
jgi:hypothetical protein